jgi:hypothetical protein
MKKFVVLYHAPAGFAAKMTEASPEEMKEHMAAWMSWNERSGSALLDMGAPLGNAQTVAAGGGGSPSESTVNGYSLLQAEDMNAALALLEGHPHLANGECSIEVHECMPLPSNM